MAPLAVLGKGLTFVTTILLSLTLALGFFEDPMTDASSPDLCVIHTPLESKYISAWLDRDRITTHGCWGATQPLAPLELEVHIIRATHALDEVELKLEGDWFTSTDGPPSKLVMILDSPNVLRWKIRGRGPLHEERSVVLLVTGQSEIEDSEIRVTVQKHSNVNQNVDFSAIRLAKKRYGQVTSYSVVRDANKLAFTRGSNGNEASICDLESSHAPKSGSPVLSATFAEKRTLSGCYHKAEVGKLNVDLHIMEVEVKPSARVNIHLMPELERGFESRNMTLVLRSNREDTIWVVSASDRLHGFLRVMSKGVIENRGVSTNLTFEAVKENYPEAFEHFILQIALTVTVPISYTKVVDVTSVDITIGRKGPDTLPGYTEPSAENRPWRNAGSSVSVGRKDVKVANKMKGRQEVMRPSPARRNDGSMGGLAKRIQNEISLLCEAKRMTAELPVSLGPVIGMTFSDRSCAAKRNGTHWSLHSVVTSCGATVRSDGRVTSYSNMVYVKVSSSFISDDEDFEGSGFGFDGPQASSLLKAPSITEIAIPHDCQYEPLLPIGSFVQDSDDNVLDPPENTPFQLELYHMEVYRDKEMRIPLNGVQTETDQKGLGISSFASEVGYDDTLYVKTWVDGVPYVQIVTEKCWVSDTYGRDRPPKVDLIRNTCPADISVRVHHKSSGGSFNGFSFKMSQDYAELGMMYLHCKLGLCTSDPRRAQGNLKLCVNPREHCENDVLRPFLEGAVSTAQQILVRGPIIPVPKVLPPETAKPKHSYDTAPSDNNTVSGAQVIVMGVSTEIAIGIAVVSFIVGASLVAALWYIHAKTGTAKQIRTVVGIEKSSGILGSICPPPVGALPPVHRQQLQHE